ncbi:MAG: hypothetical protein R2849_13695 [Thermomicrobiales bacterium]
MKISTRPGGPSRAPYAGSTRANGLPEFVDELSAANAGNGTRQAGWLLVEHRDGDDGGVELAFGGMG